MQIRNAPHFGHEEIFKYILTHNDILVLNPILGIKKKKCFPDKINFNSLEDFETYPCAFIVYPFCSNELSIKMKDLKRHQNTHFSNLTLQQNIILNQKTYTNFLLL